MGGGGCSDTFSLLLFHVTEEKKKKNEKTFDNVFLKFLYLTLKKNKEKDLEEFFFYQD